MTTDRFLSFNPKVSDAANLNDLPELAEKINLDTPLPLAYKWKLWEQIEASAATRSSNTQYSSSTKELTSFNTVQGFWEIWHQLPQPSALLTERRMIRKGKDGVQQEVDALMIFKDGIAPMWEDPQNKMGYHLEFRFAPNSLSKGQIDEYWNNLVLGLIGNTLEDVDSITGVRMVDKLSVTYNPALRIEVWFRSFSETEVNFMLEKVKRCMSKRLDGSQGRPLKAEIKKHFK